MSMEKKPLNGSEPVKGPVINEMDTKVNNVIHQPLLYRRIAEDIKRQGNVKDRAGIVPYPVCYGILLKYRLSKDDAVFVFDELCEMNLIRLVPYRGIEVVGV